MKRFPVVLSVISVAVLAACAEYPVSPAPAPVVVQPSPPPVVVQPSPPPVTSSSGTVVVPPSATAPAVIVPPAAPPLRAGIGRIEQMMPSPSAAAGGTAPGPSQRLGIRMEDGSFQYVDTSAQEFRVGDRVQITMDGYIRRPM